MSEHGGNLSPTVSANVTSDTLGDPMLSQPPPWISPLNGVTSPQNRQTSDHQRLETHSTKGNNFCDPSDPIDKKGRVSLASLSDINEVSHFKSKLTELDIRRKRVSQAAKSKLGSLQKRLLTMLPTFRNSNHNKKEKKCFKKFWLCTPNGHILKLYSYKLDD